LEIAAALDWIVIIWAQQGYYDLPIEYLENCLRVREVSLFPGESAMILTLSYLSILHDRRREYELSLTYEMKLFLIREKVLSLDHQGIAKTLSNIGQCYENFNQVKLALEYYNRTLVFYEQRSPDSFEEECRMRAHIQQLSTVLSN